MGVRVLVVDDSPQFRVAAGQLLTGCGLEVFGEAADGDQALALIRDACPDGVLVDLNLPGLDGFTLATQLARICPTARIVLTSVSVASLPDEVLASCGARAFVPKEGLAFLNLRALFNAPDT